MIKDGKGGPRRFDLRRFRKGGGIGSFAGKGGGTFPSQVSLPSGPGGKVYQFVFSHEKRRGFQR
jgi:hypothetical protein